MDNESIAANQFKGKPHFEILDGLRGIAALAVVIFHFTEWIFPDRRSNFIGHGFLAVDFFFCLSGFVIGYAYDNRMSKISIPAFLKIRLIRLHPLVVLGSILGLFGFLMDPYSNPSDQGIERIILLFVASLLLIPLPLMEDRAFHLFPFNSPSWSLFWEYLANLFYALVLVKLSRRSLFVLTVLTAISIGYVSYKYGNLIGGSTKYNYWVGGVRVAYSFSAGLLLFRSNWIFENKLSFPLLAMLLSISFLLPGSAWNWLTEPLAVIFFFPLMVALGAGSTCGNKWVKWCRFSGNISYPLYMTHAAAIWIFGHYYTNTHPSHVKLILILVCSILFLILFSYLVHVFFDIPVRKYFSRKQ